MMGETPVPATASRDFTVGLGDVLSGETHRELVEAIGDAKMAGVRRGPRRIAAHVRGETVLRVIPETARVPAPS